MKTVEVRIAVAVTADGDWNSCGARGMDEGDMRGLAIDPLPEGERMYWLTAVLEVPEVQTVLATVEKE